MVRRRHGVGVRREPVPGAAIALAVWSTTPAV